MSKRIKKDINVHVWEAFNKDLVNFTGIVIYPPECTIEYRINGVVHREDGPAVITGLIYKSYYINNLHHRLGGPSKLNGKYGYNYHLYGKPISKEKHDFLYSVYLESEEEYIDLLKFEGFI